MAECKGCVHKNVCDGNIGHGYFECTQFKNAADVVEVVRCKDCVYRMELHPMYAYEGRSCKVCFIRNKPVSDNGYCSDAIRKEDE